MNETFDNVRGEFGVFFDVLFDACGEVVQVEIEVETAM